MIFSLKKKSKIDYEKVVKMGYSIQQYLEKNAIFDATPRELMMHLIEKGFFKFDVREGKPLRDILRNLDDNDMLCLLPQVRVDRFEANRKWYFNVYHH